MLKMDNMIKTERSEKEKKKCEGEISKVSKKKAIQSKYKDYTSLLSF